MHLVNYRHDEPFQEISIRLRLPEGRSAIRVTLANPRRGQDLPAPFVQEGAAVTFNVPVVDIYELAIIELE